MISYAMYNFSIYPTPSLPCNPRRAIPSARHAIYPAATKGVCVCVCVCVCPARVKATAHIQLLIISVIQSLKQREPVRPPAREAVRPPTPAAPC